MTAKHLCWTVRGIIALNWLVMGLILTIANVPKNMATSAFGVFRICAVCVVAYLVYESSLITQKRATRTAWVVDGLLVLSMFLFWFAVRASTF